MVITKYKHIRGARRLLLLPTFSKQHTSRVTHTGDDETCTVLGYYSTTPSGLCIESCFNYFKHSTASTFFKLFKLFKLFSKFEDNYGEKITRWHPFQYVYFGNNLFQTRPIILSFENSLMNRIKIYPTLD